MTGDLVLRNARIVLEREVRAGALLIRDGLIADISGDAASGEDMEGDYVMPGIVELHTDHLEVHYAPRPGVVWSAHGALLAHDAQLAAAGATTVFDALRVGRYDEDALELEHIAAMADAIAEAGADGRLRAEHFIHLRCELSAADCAADFTALAPRPRVALASLMDHAPGQRQFANLQSYRDYYQGKLGYGDAVFDAFCAERIAQSEAYSAENRAAVVGGAQALGLVLASHDDATEEHVAEAVASGVRIAEFPTTGAAAEACAAAGIVVMMGGPNLVRGGSHSGNLAARDLAASGRLDILSSDYVPNSTLQGVMGWGLGEGGDLAAAIRMATANPARAVGLTDRGVIAPWLRADLIRVRETRDGPVVRSVWREGRRVA